VRGWGSEEMGRWWDGEMRGGEVRGWGGEGTERWGVERWGVGWVEGWDPVAGLLPQQGGLSLTCEWKSWWLQWESGYRFQSLPSSRRSHDLCSEASQYVTWPVQRSRKYDLSCNSNKNLASCTGLQICVCNLIPDKARGIGSSVGIGDEWGVAQPLNSTVSVCVCVWVWVCVGVWGGGGGCVGVWVWGVYVCMCASTLWVWTHNRHSCPSLTGLDTCALHAPSQGPSGRGWTLEQSHLCFPRQAGGCNRTSSLSWGGDTCGVWWVYLRSHTTVPPGSAADWGDHMWM